MDWCSDSCIHICICKAWLLVCLKSPKVREKPHSRQWIKWEELSPSSGDWFPCRRAVHFTTKWFHPSLAQSEWMARIRECCPLKELVFLECHRWRRGRPLCTAIFYCHSCLWQNYRDLERMVWLSEELKRNPTSGDWLIAMGLYSCIRSMPTWWKDLTLKISCPRILVGLSKVVQNLKKALLLQRSTTALWKDLTKVFDEDIRVSESLHRRVSEVL